MPEEVAQVLVLAVADQRELHLRDRVLDRVGEPLALAALRRHQLMYELLHQRRAGGIEALAVEDLQALGVAGLKLAQAPVSVRTCSAIS